MTASDHAHPTAGLDRPAAEDFDRTNAPAARRLSSQLEAFLLDRFTTTLEDPYTGRRVRR